MYPWQRATTPVGINLLYNKRDVGDPPISLAGCPAFLVYVQSFQICRFSGVLSIAVRRLYRL